MNKTYLTIFCTVPNEETALTISRDLVENQLAACCNILPGIRSIYSWKGEICDDTEYLL
ncbi:MAG: divalent-cation tolerance protein CutA, partial [Methanobacteriota archaeon]